MTGILDPSSYSFSAYSIPTTLTALGILGLGLVVLVRERIWRVSISFFILALAVSIWLLGFSVAYSSVRSEVAGFWLRAAYLGVPFIAPATYRFALTVLGKYEPLKRRVWLCWTVAAAFAYLLVFTNLLFEGVQRYWWGYYPRYNGFAILFILFFCSVLVMSMYRYVVAYRSSEMAPSQKRRTRALMTAFAVGYLGIFDFVAVYGIPLYPFGFLSIAGFVVLSARAIWIYRLVDITPAFAAKEIIATMTDALLVFDAEGVVRLANKAALSLFETSTEEVVGRPAATAFDDGFFASQVSKLLGGGPVASYELAYCPDDALPRNLSISTSSMRDRHGRPSATVLIARDITERKGFEAKLEHQALHDPLTNLPNRTLFADTLGHAVARHCLKQDLGHLAVLFLDMDNFKTVNDSLGHGAGDKLIVAASKRILDCLEPGSTLARFAADEFAILLEDLASPEEALHMAEIIHDAFRRSVIRVEDQDLFITMSTGVAIWPGPGTSAEDLLRNADIAMHEAKQGGRAQYTVYNPDMDSRARMRLQRETDLRQAFERRELAIFYQPLVRLETGQIFGFEALLRWTHPQRGPISPAEFIPLAEETGLIVPIGRWILEEACRQTKIWQARYPERPLVISVNLSPRQFTHPRLVEDIACVLHETRLQPGLLQLEVTESIGFEDTASANATLWRLKDLGLHVALDDFGTGYSSLGYLKHFPIDTIKLDRSFVSGLGQSATDTAIIHAAIAFAKALRLSITAEGIETGEQLSQLLKLGCDHGQGYYFARPIPADRAAALIARGHAGEDIRWDATTDRKTVAFVP